jgi:hypothetical protein
MPVVPTDKHRWPTLIIGAEHLFPATRRLNRRSKATGIELLQHSMHKQFAASAATDRHVDRTTTTRRPSMQLFAHNEKARRPSIDALSVLRKWRRRESNPEDVYHSLLENKTCSASQEGLAADWQRINCHFRNVPECDLLVIRELHLLHFLWPQLPAESRRQILNDVGRIALTIHSV